LLWFSRTDARPFERPFGPWPVVPMVVVAEDRDDSERRSKSAESLGDRLRRDPGAERDMVDEVVAREQHQIRVLGVGGLDQALEVLEVPIRRADVEIREQCDPEPRGRCGPRVDRQLDPVHDQAAGFEPNRPPPESREPQEEEGPDGPAHVHDATPRGRVAIPDHAHLPESLS
jgi:hypothetical protein